MAPASVAVAAHVKPASKAKGNEMVRRARFTKSEMDRIFSAAKSAGVNVRIVLTKDGFFVETIGKRTEAEPDSPGLRVLDGKDIIL